MKLLMQHCMGIDRRTRELAEGTTGLHLLADSLRS
jgi:hypothetical protein